MDADESARRDKCFDKLCSARLTRPMEQLTWRYRRLASPVPCRRCRGRLGHTVAVQPAAET